MAPTKSPQINSHLVPAPPYPPGKLMCPPTALSTRQTSHASTERTAPPPPRLPGKPPPAHLEATRLGWQFNTAHNIYLAKASGEGFCPQPAKLLFITWPRVGSINIRNEIRHPPCPPGKHHHTYLAGILCSQVHQVPYPPRRLPVKLRSPETRHPLQNPGQAQYSNGREISHKSSPRWLTLSRS